MTHDHTLHDHGHSHGHVHGHVVDSSANLQLAFFLNVGFAVIELIGGLLTGSLAILSDALHDLGDSLSLALAWVLQRLSLRRGNYRFSFGYRRYSLVGALLNTLILVGGSAYVLSRAIPRLTDPVQPNAAGMLGLALLGIAVNGVAAYRLSRDRSLNARAVTLHLMEDVLGWAAVLLVGIIMMFVTVPILDPLISIVISIWVLYNAIRGVRQAAGLFLQAVPAGTDLEAIEERLNAIQGVLSSHHTHLWSLDGERHVFSTHLVVPEGTSAEQLVAIKCAAREVIDDPAISHTTFELEFIGEQCPMRDSSCGVECTPGVPAHASVKA
ncbi:MAG: cation diffusion facilitator family transporter [Anaerolineae bacterium]